MDLSRFCATILIVYCAANLLICALSFAGPAAIAQQAPPAAMPHGGGHTTHAAPAAASATFKATVLYEAPLLGTEARIYRLYTIDLGPSGATPRHMHPGDEIAQVIEGSVTLEMEANPHGPSRRARLFIRAQ